MQEIRALSRINERPNHLHAVPNFPIHQPPISGMDAATRIIGHGGEYRDTMSGAQERSRQARDPALGRADFRGIALREEGGLHDAARPFRRRRWIPPTRWVRECSV